MNDFILTQANIKQNKWIKQYSKNNNKKKIDVLFSVLTQRACLKLFISYRTEMKNTGKNIEFFSLY